MRVTLCEFGTNERCRAQKMSGDGTLISNYRRTTILDRYFTDIHYDIIGLNIALTIKCQLTCGEIAEKYMKFWIVVFSTLIGSVAGSTFALADAIVVSYGAPGIEVPADYVSQNATVFGTESFDAATGSLYTTNFGTSGSHTITGTYTSAYIVGGDIFGGADGTPYIDAIRNTPGYVLKLAESGVPGVNYFGFWLSALDSGNELVLKNMGVPVFTFMPSDVISSLGSCPSSYCGNPSGPFENGDGGQQFAFVNFVDLNGMFDEIDFSETPNVAGNYESDNHSVAYCADPSLCVGGTIVPMPEPMTVSLFGAGVSLAAILRRRRNRNDTPATP